MLGRVKRAIATAVVKRGYILAEFDRVSIAADGPQPDGIYTACPGFDGGRIAAWAWGFHRVVDWLQTLDLVDGTRIAVTGHSRGGKAALLAGASDERIALSVPKQLRRRRRRVPSAAGRRQRSHRRDHDGVPVLVSSAIRAIRRPRRPVAL